MSRKNRSRLVFREAGELQVGYTLIDYGADWKVLEGANGHDLGFEDPSFDDSGWSTEPAAFGYVLDGTPTQGPTVPPCVVNRDLVQTAWSLGTDLTLRKAVSIPSGTTKLHFEFGADNQAFIYVDGDLIEHAQGIGCQTRGSMTAEMNNPPTGSVVIAVRAVDNALSEPGGADGYTGVLKETFFDMKVVAIGSFTSGDGVSADRIDAATITVGSSGANLSGCGTFLPADPTLINDGNLATPSRICNGVVSGPSVNIGYWVADLGQSYSVDSSRVWTHNDPTDKGSGNGTFRVYYSLTGTSGPWALAGSIGSWEHAGDGMWHEVTFAAIDARYWKLEWYYNETRSGLQFFQGTGVDQWETFGEEPLLEITPVRTGRGPGRPVAIIEDMKSMAVSEYHNGPGELYFTLPNSHPQIGSLLPWETHWAFEQYTSEGWTEKAAGWLIDYDATDEETVFYGLDYLGTLSMMHDERFNPEQAPDVAATLWPEDGGGAKYVVRRIDSIIMDQIDRAIHTPNSNVGFFVRGAIASMPETVTIFCTLAERLEFMSGMLDSHRAGTGKRTRLLVNKVRTWATPFSWEDEYRFEVHDNPGQVRPDLMMRDGELVQGFRIVPFGDFATRSLGIGRTDTGFRLEYDITSMIPPSGQDGDFFERNYGRITRVNYWDNIIDLNDLKRRNLQYAAQVGSIGKRLGLGLRVDAIGLKDGWDIGDSVPVDITRDPVDTTAMGGEGYWTIWGWAYFLQNDGHAELITTLLPKEQEGELAEDLLSSQVPATANDVTVSDTDPDTTTSPASRGTWINTTTGHVWKVDPATGLWYDATAAGDMSGLFASLTVEDEGAPLATGADTLNFVGDGVAASGTGKTKTVTIPGTPVGAAGGDLSGTYPNPTLAAGVVRDSGRWELVTEPGSSAPPVNVYSPDGDDWLYHWVED
jgi:hypothetical protein